MAIKIKDIGQSAFAIEYIRTPGRRGTLIPPQKNRSRTQPDHEITENPSRVHPSRNDQSYKKREHCGFWVRLLLHTSQLMEHSIVVLKSLLETLGPMVGGHTIFGQGRTEDILVRLFL